MKFIIDDMLGKLARKLRMLGFDAAYPKTSTDGELIKKSKEEGRLILTRDLGMTKIRGANALLIKSTVPDNQLKELFKSLKLKSEKMFSRCPVCNNILEHAEKNKVKDKVPPLVYETFDDFTYCPTCDRVYWKGTHFDKILKELKSFG